MRILQPIKRGARRIRRFPSAGGKTVCFRTKYAISQSIPATIAAIMKESAIVKSRFTFAGSEPRPALTATIHSSEINVWIVRKVVRGVVTHLQKSWRGNREDNNKTDMQKYRNTWRCSHDVSVCSLPVSPENKLTSGITWKQTNFRYHLKTN